MKFLTKQDVYFTIDEENLDEITNCNDYILSESEDRALESVKEFLRGRYDIEFELRPYTSATSGYTDLQRVLNTGDIVTVYHSTTGLFTIDDRNYSIKTIVLDLMKYELFQRIAPRQISQIVVDRYDRAIQKLTDINKGMLTMNLKLLTNANDQTYMPFRYGNNLWSDKYKW